MDQTIWNSNDFGYTGEKKGENETLMVIRNREIPQDYK